MRARAGPIWRRSIADTLDRSQRRLLPPPSKSFPSEAPGMMNPSRERFSRWTPVVLAASLLLLLAGCRGSADPADETASGPPLFQDVTSASGVQFSYRNGEEADHCSMLES